MTIKRMARGSVAVLGVMGAAYLASAAMAQEEKPPAEMPPMLTAEQVKTIWPAGLKQLTGRYVFIQVASPGGLWGRFAPPKGKEETRQVSLNELPAALRQKLTTAEIVISDLELPTLIEATQRESPSKRGLLRFYTETAIAKVSVKNLPGMSGQEGDAGNYVGRVLLRLDHQGHSNPSVNGVLQQRLQAEPTWGAAAVDFADLMASTLPPPPKEGVEAPPAAAGNGAAAAKKAPPVPEPAARGDQKAKPKSPKTPEKDHGDHDEEFEGSSVISNARILRSGVEIFAFVEWESRSAKGIQRYYGAVRLLKREPAAPPAAIPAARLPRSAALN